ncbi:hypothetical protein D3P07_24195 [Paenibacillus sp. 1011MAR3C5]|uniref:hypothetical protein n=1 Tax=Paenibacillus sp. 1011MAR3C5 TaxID=1675787 RepID=UPI000E6D1F10|nr:hypothetical protein [Paenibacillus sp. 1011MAR3C5]RJE83915.1 hypothetical protein D3P07_24195 [Paenibacillus sp. 1011MAR3C5]
MDLLIRGIPAKALFYHSDSNEAYEVFVSIQHGWPDAPRYCRRYGDVDILEVERCDYEFIHYVHNRTLKRYFVEKMIMDTESEIQMYEKEIMHCPIIHLAQRWAETDNDRWWTQLYPSRFELLRLNKQRALRRLKRYLKLRKEC